MRLDVDMLIEAYRRGAFPMASRQGRIQWFTADPRGILPLESFHIPASLAQVVRQGRFEVRINHDFRAAMSACAQNRDGGTWISAGLVDAYDALHRAGMAHSVECWRAGRLVGGLYGVSLGAAFFGESMFHIETHASKVALVHLVERLRERGFELLDAQATTPHLEKFGAIEIPSAQYLELLAAAIDKPRRFA